MEKYKQLANENKIVIVLALIATFKYFMFYSLMDVNTYFFVVVMTSLAITALLFSIFPKQWIGGAVYLAMSLIMVADATYYSFFRKYLSFNMLGAAEVVGDIGASIKEVFQPVYLVCILDAVIILAVILIRDYFIRQGIKKDKIRESQKREKHEGLFKLGALAVLLITIIGASFFSSFAQSLRNQEFFSFHIYDAISCAFPQEKGSLEAFENSYKDEIGGSLFGVAKGRNVVFIQLESFMNFGIGLEYNGQEITPNLNALIKDNSIYCENFYQQVGSGNTSDAEFAANNSIYGTVLSYTYKVYGETNYFRGLPVLLGEQGYDTAVFHAFEERDFWNREKAYPNQGFKNYYGGLVTKGGDYTMVDWMGWGLNDSDFFLQTAQLMEDRLQEPYYAFVNTLSNHHPFEMLPKYQFIKLGKDMNGTIVGNYLQSINYTDYSLGIFFEDLKKRGMYEDSIFVIYGDHAGITHNEVTNKKIPELLGKKSYTDDILLNLPCIIHIPNPDRDVTQVVDKACGHLDILPTVAYLMGWNDLDTVYFGHNMLSEGIGFVAEQTFVKRGSFIYGDIMYKMSLDGVFENGTAWEISSGRSVSLDGLKEYYLKGMELINACEYVLETDALRSIYQSNGSLANLGKGEAKRAPYPDAVVYSGFPDQNLIGKQSLEALNLSYDSGYRYIKINLSWSKDGSHAYFRDKKTGKIAMDEGDLIEWFKSHSDARLVVEIDGEKVNEMDNTLTFFGNLGEDGTALGRSIVLYEATTEDYTGRHDVFLDVSSEELSTTDNAALNQFIDINKVWAIVMSEEDYQGKRAELVTKERKVYVAHPEGTIEPAGSK